MDANYLRVFDNVLEEHQIDTLLDSYRASHAEKRESDILLFDEVNLGKTHVQLAMNVIKVAEELLAYYKKLANVKDYQMPAKHGFEYPRIKRYYNSSCYFKDHIDAADYESTKRFIGFLFYLNKPDGGETVFYNGDEEVVIEAIPGRVVMFPPNWTYPHRANPVKSGEKFIMSTYLHYVKE